ncbi:MAG: extracellular solute-binding protein [Synechococcus sp.]|nr:extracellular solute-binding protein [Synechococcus sp.]
MASPDRSRRLRSLPVVGGVVALVGAAAAAALLLPRLGRPPATEIGVYSGRHYNTDQELYRRFTAQTGIRVRLLEGKDDALIERVRNEGSGTPADVLVLVDAARLDKAASQNLFAPIRSPQLERDVPARLRDPQGRWFALTRRVRLVVVNPGRVNPASIRTYADLAAPALKGQLCLRNNRSVYNQSLVADQWIQRGEAATRRWVEGMVANLGQPFFTSDIPLARAVARGECGAALVNSYYVARMLAGASGSADQEAAGRLKVVFPDPAHVNVSGAGVTRASRQKEAATRLIEFLASPSGGVGYAEANLEYPLKGFGNNPILRRFGPFREDDVTIQQMGEKNREAVQLMQAAGWS